MNYQRVYDEFIADRRAKESGLVKGTFERHHVLPRMLGGGNEAENIIRLVHSDHLFAHALLAEIHGGRMISCAARMSGYTRYIGKNARAKYQSLRNKHAQNMSERMKSFRHTPESLAKSTAHAKGNNYNTGKKRSAELRAGDRVRAKERAARPGASERNSLGVKAAWADPNSKMRDPEILARRAANTSKTLSGRKKSPEAVANSVAAKKKARAERLAAGASPSLSPEHCAAISRGLIGNKNGRGGKGKKRSSETRVRDKAAALERHARERAEKEKIKT